MSDVAHCAQCGRALPPPAGRLQLTPQQRYVYEAVKERPRSCEQLRIILWGISPDAACEKAIHVVVYHLNKRLKPHGLMLRSINRRYYITNTPNADPIVKSA